MRYLCLVYIEPAKLQALSQGELAELNAEAVAFDEELRRSGHYVAASALEPVEAATTLRVRDGRLSITDGPFAETKEHLGGFVLIEARDLNEAMHVAARIPPARIGSIEVRPVRPIGQCG